MRQRPAEPGGPRLGQPPHPPTPARAAIRLSWAHQSRSAAAWATCPTRNGRSQDRFPCPDGRCRNAAWPTSLPN